ncbi:hypothetical protein LTR66_014342 [Elasticomyces elasticus]|nr:hypothetical protein LTR66_014342 [Elasticomyces elasticus]
MPTTWNTLPGELKTRIIIEVLKDTPCKLPHLIREDLGHIHEAYDYKVRLYNGIIFEECYNVTNLLLVSKTFVTRSMLYKHITSSSELHLLVQGPAGFLKFFEQVPSTVVQRVARIHFWPDEFTKNFVFDYADQITSIFTTLFKTQLKHVKSVPVTPPASASLYSEVSRLNIIDPISQALMDMADIVNNAPTQVRKPKIWHTHLLHRGEDAHRWECTKEPLNVGILILSI